MPYTFNSWKDILYNHEDIVVFEVHDSAEGRGKWYGKWPGAVRPDLKWATERLQAARFDSQGTPGEATERRRDRACTEAGEGAHDEHPIDQARPTHA